MACFTDLATVKAALGITDTASDVVLQSIVDGVNAELLAWFHLDDCGPTQYTSSYDIVDEVAGIWLQQYPVISVDSVTVDGVVQDSATFYLDNRVGELGHMRRKRAGSVRVPDQFPIGPQMVTVTHTAGWAGGVPDASLQRAATLLAVYDWNTGAKQGFQSEKIGQYSYTLRGGSGATGVSGAEGGGWPGPVARVLAQWARPFAEGG